MNKGWNKRWIILKDDMINYLNNSNSVVGKNVNWFDEDNVISGSKGLVSFIGILSYLSISIIVLLTLSLKCFTLY